EGKIWPKLSLNGSIGYISTSFIGNLLNKEIPLGGGFSGLIGISDSFKNPEFNAHLKGVGLYYQNLAIPEWSSKIYFKDGNLNIENMDMKFSDSEILFLKGSLIDLKENKFKLKTELRNVHAGPFTVFGGVNLKGELYENNQKYGIKGLIGAEDLWINQHNAARTFIGFDFYESTVTFGNYSKTTSIAVGSMGLGKWPRIQFNKLKLSQKGKSFEIDGILGLKKSDFIVTTKNLPGSTLSEIVELPMNIEGPINSIIIGKGSFEQPHVIGNIAVSSGSFAEMPFNTLTVNFHIKNNVLKIYNSGIAQKDKYVVTLDGFVPFSLTKEGAKRILNNKVELALAIEKENLSVFNGLLEDISFEKGDLEARVNLAGTLSKPTWNGSLKISKGELNSKRYFKKFKDINVDLSLKNNLLKIVEFSGKIGGGLNRLSGSVIFEGFKPKKFDLNWKTEKDQGITISVPQLPIPTPLVKTDEWSLFSNLSHGDPKFNLNFYGPMDKLMLSGWVEMENTRFSYPSLLKAEDRESMLDVLWPIMSLDIELRSGKNTWYDNELASINFGGSIKLTGKADDPKVNGKIEAQRGIISYFGSEFTVKQALLEIVNDEVYLEAEASCEAYIPGQSIPDTITMIIDRAEISKIKPRFSSKDNQQLTSEKALARAARMDPSMYEGEDREFLMRRQLIRVIDSSLATPIARNILRKSGLVDQFKVQYIDKTETKPVNPNQTSMVDILYGTKYSMEKYLTNQVLFGYSLIFDRLQDHLAFRHELELSYKWTKNIFLRGSYQPANKDLGSEGERKISIEQMFRFGGAFSKKKKKK
ncbi:MAG: translocation/assembly module TamB domain-containing protein, partial [Elusimicrobia bacterium]|nr:translocation/assembly module TamB domain-containing protein [Elusimicrobiota bacterium]